MKVREPVMKAREKQARKTRRRPSLLFLEWRDGVKSVGFVMA